MKKKNALLTGLFMVLAVALLLCGCGKEKGPKLNGVSLSKYRIVGETEDYGTKIAVDELTKGMKELTDGVEPKCKYGAKAGNKVIYIADGPSDVGTYSIKVDGNKITLSGPGINGRRMAVRKLLSLLAGKEEVTIKTSEYAMFELPKTADKIASGELTVGFIGDSITAEDNAAYDPWPMFVVDELKKMYPDTTFKTRNVAKHGEQTTWGSKNIGEFLLKTGYSDLIFVALGTNDQFKKVTSEETKANYLSMIQQIHEKNPDAEIVFVMVGRNFELSGIEGLEEGKISDFMSHMLTVSDEYNIPIIEPMSALYDACVEYAGEEQAMEKGWQYYMIDDVHPFGHGQELYAKVVWEHIKEALK